MQEYNRARRRYEACGTSVPKSRLKKSVVEFSLSYLNLIGQLEGNITRAYNDTTLLPVPIATLRYCSCLKLSIIAIPSSRAIRGNILFSTSVSSLPSVGPIRSISNKIFPCIALPVSNNILCVLWLLFKDKKTLLSMEYIEYLLFSMHVRVMYL